ILVSPRGARSGRRHNPKERSHPMNALRLGLVGLLVVGVAARAADKKDDNKTKIVGDWTITKSFDGGPPVDSVVTFTKDGKMKVVDKKDGKEQKFEGTYTADADSFSFELKSGETTIKEKITIKKLSADEMSTTNKDGKGVDLKKKK